MKTDTIWIEKHGGEEMSWHEYWVRIRKSKYTSWDRVAIVFDYNSAVTVGTHLRDKLLKG